MQRNKAHLLAKRADVLIFCATSFAHRKESIVFLLQKIARAVTIPYNCVPHFSFGPYILCVLRTKPSILVQQGRKQQQLCHLLPSDTLVLYGLSLPQNVCEEATRKKKNFDKGALEGDLFLKTFVLQPQPQFEF